MGNTLDPNFKAERDAKLQAELEATTDPDAKVILQQKIQLVADLEAAPIVASVSAPVVSKDTSTTLRVTRLGKS